MYLQSVLEFFTSDCYNFAGRKAQVLSIWNSIICMLLKLPNSVLHTSHPFCMQNCGVMITGTFSFILLFEKDGSFEKINFHKTFTLGYWNDGQPSLLNGENFFLMSYELLFHDILPYINALHCIRS
jgi:hypothetical protein